MTAKAKAAIKQFDSEQFALRNRVAAYLANSSSADRLKILVNAGVLTKSGKLAAPYRPHSSAAADEQKFETLKVRDLPGLFAS